MVMMYYAFSLVFLLLLRPAVIGKFVENRGSKSVYAALYFLPILVITQAIFGGLLCKDFFNSLQFVYVYAYC